MFCKNCGKPITEDSRFCPECGVEQFTTSGQETVTSEIVDGEIATSIDAKLKLSAVLFVVASAFSLLEFLYVLSGIVKDFEAWGLGVPIVILLFITLCLTASLLIFKQKYKATAPILIVLSIFSILMVSFFAFSIFQLITLYYSIDARAVILSCLYLLLYLFTLLISIPSIFLIVYKSNFWMLRNKWVVFVLCLFFGVLGLHRFYAGKISSGVLYLATGGCLGIGVLVDLISILIDTFKDAQGRALKG